MPSISELESLLTPKKMSEQRPKRFSIRIDGMPKTGKSALAVTASKDCPHPSKWSAQNPVELKDVLWLAFEENCLLYPSSRGIHVTNVFDWSSPDLTFEQIKGAIKSLPALKPQFEKKGIKTIVVDTLSTFNQLLLRDMVQTPTFAKDMDRIRAYGQVNDAHDLLFDSLRGTGLNFIGLVHLEVFQPWGEDGKNDDFRKQAEKQIDKIEAMSIGGIRADFIPSMRPKAAGRWARLTDATLVTFAQEKVINAREKRLQYRFTERADSEFNCGSRWDLSGDQEPYLLPIIQKRYDF